MSGSGFEQPDAPDPSDALPPPPRAFTQGTGLVFQVVGCLLFLVMMTICCGSSLLSKDWAQQAEFSRRGWGTRANGAAVYSIQKAVTLSVFCGVFLGVALAGAGLGMQAERRKAPWMALGVTAIGVVLWTVQTVFAVTMHSLVMSLIALALAVIFAVLLALAWQALKEMRGNPPPPGHEVLPADYKVPYSHYHVDPPEVRLERELEQRRQRLEVERKEIESIEARLRRRLDEAAAEAKEQPPPDGTPPAPQR